MRYNLAGISKLREITKYSMLLNKELIFTQEEFENYSLDGTNIKGSYNAICFKIKR